MAKLDRLGWAAGMAFVSHGVRLGVRVNHLAVMGRIREHLPPSSKPASPIVDTLYSLVVGGDTANSRVRRLNLLYMNAARLARTMDLEELLDAFESDLHFRVAVGAPHRLFVHAGVVGWRGRAIIIPGHSMSGKTALVQALVTAGATYYSDEFAVLDAQGRVHPYAKPLYVRGADGQQRQKLWVQELGARAGSKALPVGLVALTEFQPGACWRPRVLSPGEGVLELLGHTLLARYRPKQALETLGHVTPGALVLKGKRGEAPVVAEALLERLVPVALSSGAGARAGLATSIG